MKIYVLLLTAFLMMWLVTLGVELYDIYLLVNLSDTIGEFELNPVGRFLISLDGGKVGLFVVMKVVIMGMLLSTLPLLYRKKPNLAVTMMSVLFASRLLLLGFLLWGNESWFSLPRKNIKMVL